MFSALPQGLLAIDCVFCDTSIILLIKIKFNIKMANAKGRYGGQWKHFAVNVISF